MNGPLGNAFGKFRAMGLAAMIGLVWTNLAMAEDGPRSQMYQRRVGCDPIRRCCPDDYCRKPLPDLCFPRIGCCSNDYGRKPLPCTPRPILSCCPDDYCRKSPPRLCQP